MSPSLRNIVVVGGSYVGLGTARELMRIVPASYRVLLVEPHSHFNHIFTFPRFVVLPGHEQKAFVPYNGIFGSNRHTLVSARATEVLEHHIRINKPWEGSDLVPFDYLVIATGTTLAPPSMMPHDTRDPSVRYIQSYQAQIRDSDHVTIVGGGAVGVQMALDIKEIYPTKEVTLVHSRDRLMHQFDGRLHDILKEVFDEHGVQLITGTRAVVPNDGFPTVSSATGFEVQLTSGLRFATNFIIPATGQRPNHDLIRTLPASSADTHINKSNNFVRVRKTLQLKDETYPHIFAVGDIADTGAQKAARPGSVQAGIVARNILSQIEGDVASEEYHPGPAAIHLSLGLRRNIVFRNPNPVEGQMDPVVIEKEDGRDDMSVENMWTRLNVEPRVRREVEASL